jgi:hypothetical protein
MKYKVGDILRAKTDMVVTIGVEQCDTDENVKGGEYFVITNIRESSKYDSFGYVLLSQKTASLSLWSTDDCDLSESFTKVKV